MDKDSFIDDLREELYSFSISGGFLDLMFIYIFDPQDVFRRFVQLLAHKPALISQIFTHNESYLASLLEEYDEAEAVEIILEHTLSDLLFAPTA